MQNNTVYLDFVPLVENTCRTLNTSKPTRRCRHVGFLNFQLQHGNKHTGLNNIPILRLYVWPYLMKKTKQNKRGNEESCSKSPKSKLPVRCVQVLLEIWPLEWLANSKLNFTFPDSETWQLFKKFLMVIFFPVLYSNPAHGVWQKKTPKSNHTTDMHVIFWCVNMKSVVL